jgi:aflatoxin B1 aldehyde reductase
MTFASQTSAPVAKQQLEGFLSSAARHGFDPEIDTARMYNRGATEEMLGTLLPRLKLPESMARGEESVVVATKINPFKGFDEDLSAESCRRQCRASLEALGTKRVDILYLHAPCTKTRLEETLNAVKALHDAGAFSELGLSNHSASEVVEIFRMCERLRMVRPTVYQGMLNAITRQVELELLPVCRRLGLRFYAYNPLAGGLLTGKHSKLGSHGVPRAPEKGRFKNPMYQARFWKKAYFDAVALVELTCRAAGVVPAEAALRWLSHHSSLRPECGDAVILGASSLAHFEQNLAALTERCAPLPAPVVEAYERAWDMCRGACPCYFRGFSGSHAD